MDYLYDGSFEGALTGVYHMFHNKDQIGRVRLIRKFDYQTVIARTTTEVVTDDLLSKKVLDWILETYGQETLKRVAYAYLSENQDYGTRLFNALKRAKKLGSNGMNHLADPDIHALYDLYRKVARASHLMLGLLRFSELKNGVLYAPLNHEYALLELLISHFKNRLSSEVWVIHDVTRSLAAFYDGKAVFINPLEKTDLEELSDLEKSYQNLWQNYFKHIAIGERNNPRQQMQMMPKKYWAYLVEKPRK